MIRAAFGTPNLAGSGFADSHAFSFRSKLAGAEERGTFRATAHGDLDGDGVVSTFEVEGVSGPVARVLPGMYVDREVE
jgi:hypothetical protein